MKESMVKAINEQIGYELDSAYLYLSMSIAMKDAFFNGYAAWLEKQYKEEMEHAHKLMSYLQERGQKIELRSINIKPWDGECPVEVAKATLAHEQFITSKINALYELAMEEKDWATKEFLAWYVTEQVEEEANANEVIDMFVLAGDHRGAQMMIDAKLAGRK